MNTLLLIATGAFLIPFCFGLGCMCAFKLVEKLVD